MPQQVRRRKQTTVEFSAGNQVSESLSRGMIYRELYLRLRGALTVSAANDTAAKTKRGDEWAVIRRLRIVANGTDVLRDIDGAALRWLNYFLYGRFPVVGDEVNGVGGGNLNPSFDSVLVLPFWMPRAMRPIDTALDSRELSDLAVEITWGDHTDVNGDATGFTTEPTVEVYSLESFGISGPFSNSRVFKIEKEVEADNPQFQVQLPVNPMYRGFLINTTDGGADAADIINNIRLVSGSTVFVDMDREILSSLELIRNNLEDEPGAPASADDSRTGWLFLDMLSDGLLTEAIDTLGFSELNLELDVSVGAGTTKLRVYPYQVIPIRGGSNRG